MKQLESRPEPENAAPDCQILVLRHELGLPTPENAGKPYVCFRIIIILLFADPLSCDFDCT